MILTLRNRVKVLVYLGAVVALVVSSLEGDDGVKLSLNTLSIVEAALFATIWLFDRFLWRWWFVPRLLRTGPVLRGTWQGQVEPTGGSTEAVPVYLSVRQTYSSIAFRLMTAESTSESSSAQLRQAAEGLSVIEYFYENVPRDAVRDRSPIHFGGSRLEVVGMRPTSIQGSYFTSRRTNGEMSFRERSPKVAHTVDDAKALFRAPH